MLYNLGRSQRRSSHCKDRPWRSRTHLIDRSKYQRRRKLHHPSRDGEESPAHLFHDTTTTILATMPWSLTLLSTSLKHRSNREGTVDSAVGLLPFPPLTPPTSEAAAAAALPCTPATAPRLARASCLLHLSPATHLPLSPAAIRICFLRGHRLGGTWSESSGGGGSGRVAGRDAFQASSSLNIPCRAHSRSPSSTFRVPAAHRLGRGGDPI